MKLRWYKVQGKQFSHEQIREEGESRLGYVHKVLVTLTLDESINIDDLRSLVQFYEDHHGCDRSSRLDLVYSGPTIDEEPCTFSVCKRIYETEEEHQLRLKQEEDARPKETQAQLRKRELERKYPGLQIRSDIND